MTAAILTLNAGSSSLKFALFSADASACLLRGEVDDLFDAPTLKVKDSTHEQSISHGIEHAVSAVLDTVSKDHSIIAVGHRIVHGGMKFSKAVLLNDDIIRQLDTFTPLAPLHQPHNLEVVKLLRKKRPKTPQIASIDTAFHRTQSILAQTFPLPHKLTEEGIIRYGFHGLSYKYIASQLPHIMQSKSHGRIVVAHLGNGASLCAMQGLKSVATSMGFTALDGLMMGTRSGNIDPGILLYLLHEKGFSINELSDLLYHDSGLKGVSGISHDVRKLIASGDPKAAFAIELYCYLAAKHLGSLIPSIGGLDALIFTAGIGENCPLIRQKICAYFEWLGLEIDTTFNQDGATKISTLSSKVGVYVIPTDEEKIIAQEALSIL